MHIMSDNAWPRNFNDMLATFLKLSLYAVIILKISALVAALIGHLRSTLRRGLPGRGRYVRNPEKLPETPF